MADRWHDDNGVSAQVKDDDDDAPDDWETALDEKPKSSDVTQKPKPVVNAPSKSNKKQDDDDELSRKIIQQPEGNFTPNELDTMQQKEDQGKELDKLQMAEDLIDPDGQHQSLDTMNLLTRQEFLNYSLRLANHLEVVSKSEFYPDFIDHFLEGLTQSMSTEAVKRLTFTLQAINLRKNSEDREKKAKTKKQAKPQLKAGGRKDFNPTASTADNDYDEDADYDDDY